MAMCPIESHGKPLRGKMHPKDTHIETRITDQWFPVKDHAEQSRWTDWGLKLGTEEAQRARVTSHGAIDHMVRVPIQKERSPLKICNKLDEQITAGRWMRLSYKQADPLLFPSPDWHADAAEPTEELGCLCTLVQDSCSTQQGHRAGIPSLDVGGDI